MYHIEVACQTEGCTAYGRVRRVMLGVIALGMLAVPRLACVACGCEPIQVGGWQGGQADGKG